MSAKRKWEDVKVSELTHREAMRLLREGLEEVDDLGLRLRRIGTALMGLRERLTEVVKEATNGPFDFMEASRRLDLGACVARKGWRSAVFLRRISQDTVNVFYEDGSSPWSMPSDSLKATDWYEVSPPEQRPAQEENPE